MQLRNEDRQILGTKIVVCYVGRLNTLFFQIKASPLLQLSWKSKYFKPLILEQRDNGEKDRNIRVGNLKESGKTLLLYPGLNATPCREKLVGLFSQIIYDPLLALLEKCVRYVRQKTLEIREK